MANYYQSNEIVKKNAKIWAINPPNNQRKHQRNLPRIENLSDYTRIPLKKYVLGLYHTLLENDHSRKSRVQFIYTELITLWNKMSFPAFRRPAITVISDKLINNYEKNQRHPAEDFFFEKEKVFDVRKADGQWLCTENKIFYKKQIESKGKIGYNSLKPADSSTIHPSKLMQLKYENSQNKNEAGASSSDIMMFDESEDNEQEASSDESRSESFYQRKKHHSTKISIKLVNELEISTNKASKLCS